MCIICITVHDYALYHETENKMFWTLPYVNTVYNQGGSTSLV